MITKLCISPGCGLFAEPGHNYCKKHLEESIKRRQEWEKEHNPFKNAKRNNSAFYRKKEWKEIRKQVLENYGDRCCLCGKTEEQSGYPLEIHHKIPPKGNKELFLDSDNCVPLCKLCHARITQQEQASIKEHSTN